MIWNWGTKIILVFGLFVTAMITLVVMSMKQKVEMVTKDYYKDELRYQQVINASSLANALSTKVEIKQQDGFLLVQLPQEMAGAAVTGNLLFYCAADAAKDRQVQLQTNITAQQQISLHNFLPGNYIVKIQWTHHNMQYYTEQPLIIHQ